MTFDSIKNLIIRPTFKSEGVKHFNDTLSSPTSSETSEQNSPNRTRELRNEIAKRIQN